MLLSLASIEASFRIRAFNSENTVVFDVPEADAKYFPVKLYRTERYADKTTLNKVNCSGNACKVALHTTMFPTATFKRPGWTCENNICRRIQTASSFKRSPDSNMSEVRQSRSPSRKNDEPKTSSARSKSRSRSRAPPTRAFDDAINFVVSNPLSDPITAWNRANGPSLVTQAKARDASNDVLRAVIFLVSELTTPGNENKAKSITGIDDICEIHANRLESIVKRFDVPDWFKSVQTFQKEGRTVLLRQSPFTRLASLCPNAMNPIIRSILFAQVRLRFYAEHREFQTKTFLGRLPVRRDHLPTDSIKMMQWSPRNFLLPFKIEFKDERSRDYESVFKDWLGVIKKELMGQASPLFIHTSSILSINPQMMGERGRWPWFEYIGRLLGMCLMKPAALKVRFPVSMMNFLIGKDFVELEDIRTDFESSYLSMRDILRPGGSRGVGTMSVQDWQGRVIDFVEGGRNIAVDENNKDLYAVKKMTFVHVDQVRPLLDLLKKGFLAVVPKEVLESGCLNGRTLQRLLEGKGASNEDSR